MGFSRQEYWSGLIFPTPGDLPNPGMEPGSPALQADSLLSESLRHKCPSDYLSGGHVYCEESFLRRTQLGIPNSVWDGIKASLSDIGAG